MMHMFPRQFGLHDVFAASSAARAQTAQGAPGGGELPRHEIAQPPPVKAPKTPKRLRGAPRDLVRRLQLLHARCSYAELLRHYCPTLLDSRSSRRRPKWAAAASSLRPPSSRQTAACLSPPPPAARRPKRRPRGVQPVSPVSLPSTPGSLVDLACPLAHVSAFCQAALSKIIPNGFWGEGHTMCHNKTAFLHKVDRFVKLRRFESMTLHQVCQGLRVSQRTARHE